MRSCRVTASRAGQRNLAGEHVFKCVLLPKAFKVQTHRRRKWRRGGVQTVARGFNFHRHHEQQHQQIVQPPEPPPPKGPSRLGIGVLLGASLLLVATWHKLTSRGVAESQQQQFSLTSEVARKAQGDGVPPLQQSDGQMDKRRVTGGEIQARIQHVRAAIEAARAANRPDILRNEVIELRALRELAADLYSFNTITIEAQEVQAKMASLRRQHAEIVPPGEVLNADSPPASSSAASTPLVSSDAEEQPQQGQSLVSAFQDSQLFEPDPAQQPQAGSSSQDSLQQAQVEESTASNSGQAEDALTAPEDTAGESAEAYDEIAELANALWEEGDPEDYTQTEAEPPGQLDGVSTGEQQSPVSSSTEPNGALSELEKLEHEPELAIPLASASGAPSGVDRTGKGSHTAAEGSNGLELPLMGEEKDELKELQQELPIELHSGGVNMPHPAKADTGGEDAFFISRGAVGVADGVSAWAREGIDAALYSSCIMQHAKDKLMSGGGDSSGFDALQHSSTYCAGVDGSSTAVIALLKEQNILEVTNLGDCGFRVIREGACIFASDAQQHSFNCPYQLASPTKWPEADKPEDADVYEVELLPGDIVVLGSDGLFDNMWNHELEAVVARHTKAGDERSDADAKKLALTLANIARANALDQNYRSPWILEAAAAGKLPVWQRLRPRGGKLDDCTAVVVYAELAAPLQAQMAGAGAPVTAKAA